MGEAGVPDVVDEVLGEPPVAQTLAPRTDVDLVDAHRPDVGICGPAPLHPLVVVPGVVRAGDDRRLLRSHLGHPGHRVALEPDDVVRAPDRELVVHALLRAGEEQLPETARAESPHRMGEPVPAVEVADDVHCLRARRPQCERDAPHVAHRAGIVADVGAEHRPELLVAALVDQVPVDLAQRRGEPVGVVLLVLDPVVVRHEEAVVVGRAVVRRGHRPDAVTHVLEVDLGARVDPGPDGPGERPVAGDRQPAGPDVVAEQVMGLAVAAVQEGVDGGVVQLWPPLGRVGRVVPAWVVRAHPAGPFSERIRSTASTGIGSHDGRLRAS